MAARPERGAQCALGRVAPLVSMTVRSRLLSNRHLRRAALAAGSAARWVAAPTPEVRRWRAVDGDHTLRLEYDLDADSVVLDVGGYEGQWTSDIVAMYGCRVHVFEPVPEFAERIARRFERNTLVTVHPVGLAARDGSARLAVCGDASSHHRNDLSKNAVEVTVRDVRRVFEELPAGRADLAKLNIEGAEFELLPHLLESGLMPAITDLQVQFHAFVQDAEARVAAIRAGLARTHALTYQYDFLWENWRRHTPTS
jgi:FkbM family methyltransferase